MDYVFLKYDRITKMLLSNIFGLHNNLNQEYNKIIFLGLITYTVEPHKKDRLPPPQENFTPIILI